MSMTTPTFGGMTAERLRELRAKGTQGTWRAGRSDMVSYDAGSDDGPYKNVYVDDPRGGTHRGEPLPFTVARGEQNNDTANGETECIANAQLIAAAVNALPDLLSHIAELRAENERCKGVLREISQSVPSLSSQGWTGKSHMLSIGQVGWSCWPSDDKRGYPSATFADKKHADDFMFGRIISASTAAEIDALIAKELPHADA